MEDEILDAGALNSALNEVLESIESALESHSALNTSLSNAGDLNTTASFSAGVQVLSTASEPARCRLPKQTSYSCS